MTIECEKTRIKTPFAQIIVTGTAEMPYYQILYYSPDEKTYYVGFGSLSLVRVFQWLSEEFEIVDAPAVEPERVRHGRWVKKYHKNCLGDYFQTHCSECGDIIPVASHTNYCPNCGAKMDLEAEDET